MKYELTIVAWILCLAGIFIHVATWWKSDKTEKITGHGMGWCYIATSILFYLQTYAL